MGIALIRLGNESRLRSCHFHKISFYFYST